LYSIFGVFQTQIVIARFIKNTVVAPKADASAPIRHPVRKRFFVVSVERDSIDLAGKRKSSS
jgi:hypothetical protein